MAVDVVHELRFFSAAGVTKSVVRDFNWLVLQKGRNRPGLLEFELPGDHAAIADFEHMGQVELWRSNSRLGLDMYNEFSAFIMDPEEVQSDGVPYYTARCPGQAVLLGQRYVLWFAGIANKSEFANKYAEYIMKELVLYNLGSSATTGNGRLVNGNRTDISIEAGSTGGSQIEHYCSWDNLLESLQAIVAKGGGDFDLVQTAKNPNDWEIRFYAGQLGSDKTTGADAVVFSERNANLAEPRRRHNRRNERTVFAVLGQGDGDERDYRIVNGPDQSASNNIELYVDAKDIEKGDTDGLDSRGEDKSLEFQAIPESGFDILQTDSAYYGLHYVLGDKVAVELFGNTESHLIDSVILTSMAGQAEKAVIETVKV